ncbi:NADH-quinone oxidoreductase subunit N [Paenibacillus psychroresistens]|uniref:NADH-quinone oxidoreductase subunit N n=1 Tax=Paenibacillus psychroresistens TaxID=1778678 RepID=A0A6B8R9M5_9BACL|nr:NADH-quinone oxidoreductase subunit N [Paenibacillus psychroresistens]QGQ93489.1 NADH-quinone oxidoreductase subunit N [Paenibacillus psychroresistens]
MELHGLKWSDLSYLAPELTLVISAILLSIIDLVLPKRVSRTLLGWLSIVSIVISAGFVIHQLGVKFDLSAFSFTQGEPVRAELLHYSYRVDAFGGILKLLFLIATGLITLMSIGSIKKTEIPDVGEYYYFLLPALIGGMIMVSSADLIALFVGLELLSITSYILVGMRKLNGRSNEAAFKYIVQGGIASAMILYGMSFLYGISGSTNLLEINNALAQTSGSFTALIYVAFFLMLAGLGFKIAAAPFHSWAPDVYQGAPTPITAFLAVVSKGAAIALLFRFVYRTFYGVTGTVEQPIYNDILFTIAVLAAISMVVGNILALRQRNFKRLLAFSGIANAGYLLVPIAAEFGFVHQANFSEFTFYLIAYTFMNIGALAVFAMIENASDTEQTRGFAGLYYRAPWTAFAMVVLLLSLAGFPVTGGFFGKLFIIIGALETQKYWLVAIMIGASVIAYYYYFGLIRQMFMRSDIEARDLKPTIPLAIVIWICTIITLLLGFFPQVILNQIETIFSMTKDLFMVTG